jgi:pyruvate dehydrogenase E2 component (dihydrolipoamide acetyltransferase)
VEDALAWCEARNATVPVEQRVLPAALLLRAVVLACRAVPECNGHYVDGRFEPASHVDLGIAVSARDGTLLAPVVTAAEERGLDGLMAALRDVVARARARTLRAEHTAPASITVTSLGDQGVDVVQGVIVPPQVAIVGFGAVAARPRVRDGAVTVRRTVIATLSADHRVSHGHRGARFLRAVADVLARPEELA